jgi:SulP family sulfate permease
MFGFVNGLAIIIFMSQLEQFKTVVNGESVWLSGSLCLLCSVWWL